MTETLWINLSLFLIFLVCKMIILEQNDPQVLFAKGICNVGFLMFDIGIVKTQVVCGIIGTV